MLLKGLEFKKYHGLGNDYIIIDDLKGRTPEEKKSKLTITLCKIHFSIGADGLIFVGRSDQADIRYNKKWDY